MTLRHTAIGLAGLAMFALGPVGCGDDTEGSGGSGASSQGGGGSATTTTTTSTTSSSSGGGAGGDGGSTSEGGGGSGGDGGQGGQGGGPLTPSEQIAAVLATADGSGLSLVVADAVVTYLQPQIGSAPAGFFVQADQAGPALFVAVDPSTLTPVPALGDEVMFTVTSISTTGGLKYAATVESFMRHSAGSDVSMLVTDLDAATDVVSQVESYAARAVSFSGDIDGAFAASGTSLVEAKLKTASLDDANLRLRVPESVREHFDLQPGCTVDVDYGVLWRNGAVAQPSALSIDDFVDVVCDAPTVVSAMPLDATTVVVEFDRRLDPSSVDEGDFVFDNGLSVTAVMVDGRTVTLTTTAQVPNQSYELTVADLVDVLGSSVGSPNTASFAGYVPPAQMLLNEIKPNIAANRDLVEILVLTDGTTKGITLTEQGDSTMVLATMPDVQVQAGDLIVIHLRPAGAAGQFPGSETTAKDQYPRATYSAAYDLAWDFHGGTEGLSYGNRVVQLNAPDGSVLDALSVVRSDLDESARPADFPLWLQALQALGLWLPADCDGMPCTYTTTPSAISVSVDYNGVGADAESRTGSSISRKPGADTKTAADWYPAGTQTFGEPNP